MNEAEKNILQVRIVSPKGVLFADRAFFLSSRNVMGNFDILPRHANFITLVEGVPITIRTVQNGSKTFNFPLAIIYTKNSQVSIYTDIQGKG